MQNIHKWMLTALLMSFGMSLLVPGLIEMFSTMLTVTDMETLSQINQRRALYGMMAGLGLVSCMACYRLAQARILVIGIGSTLALVVVGRLYSLLIDGLPDGVTFFYLFVETLLAVIFLRLPPPAIEEHQTGIHQ